jgi:hypothetical protein
MDWILEKESHNPEAWFNINTFASNIRKLWVNLMQESQGMKLD